jgi:hypothetical protein
MAANYSPEQLKELDRGLPRASDALKHLVDTSLAQGMSVMFSPGSQQQIYHGAARRLNTIRRCIARIFELFPPERDELLSRDVLLDVQVYLQAFILNVSGVLDNWAWAFVLRHRLDIDHRGVGLFRLKTQRALPPEFREYLQSQRVKDWHEIYLKAGRDSLAHRIPQYVPPAFWTPADAERYRELEAELSQSLERREWERASEIQDKQQKLGSACAAFLGEPFRGGERRAPVVLHSQLIVDCLTVDEIGRRFYACWQTNRSSCDTNEFEALHSRLLDARDDLQAAKANRELYSSEVAHYQQLVDRLSEEFAAVLKSSNRRGC